MSWRVPLAFLIAFLVIGATMTVLSFQRSPTDTVEVQLGIVHSDSPAFRAIDQASAQAYERRQFSGELKQRLAKPHRTIELSEFFVDSCEVSQLEWEQYAEWATAQPGMAQAVANDWLTSKSTGHRIAGRMTSPASGINYTGASAYCTAAGGRLPFAEEFEAMSSGQEARLYPWGDEFHSDAWPYNSAERNAAQACEAHPTTSTPSGIHDLGSNAMEWGQGPMFSQSTEFKPSIHGAPAARQSARELYALNAAWLLAKPEIRSNHLGFRCVYGLRPTLLPWKKRRQSVVLIEKGEYKIGLPEAVRLPLFIANMPAIRGISIERLLQDDAETRTQLKVDRCEVTREKFGDFLSDPLVRAGMFNNETQPIGVNFEPLRWDDQLENPSLPVFGVNWWAADAYARWAGGRLPSVEEWRQLATGTNGYIYPWGMQYEAGAAQNGDQASVSLAVCASGIKDVTPQGIADLGGNLSEWTRSLAAQNSLLAMWVQGGNWLLPGEETAKSMFGRTVPMNHQSKTIGFRVVYN